MPFSFKSSQDSEPMVDGHWSGDFYLFVGWDNRKVGRRPHRLEIWSGIDWLEKRTQEETETERDIERVWCSEGNIFCGNIRLLLLFAVHSQPVAYPPAALSSRVPAIASTRSAIFLSSFFVLPSPLYLPPLPSPFFILCPTFSFIPSCSFPST